VAPVRRHTYLIPDTTWTRLLHAMMMNFRPGEEDTLTAALVGTFDPGPTGFQVMLPISSFKDQTRLRRAN
jgi:hypothetical protein